MAQTPPRQWQNSLRLTNPPWHSTGHPNWDHSLGGQWHCCHLQCIPPFCPNVSKRQHVNGCVSSSKCSHGSSNYDPQVAPQSAGTCSQCQRCPIPCEQLPPQYCQNGWSRLCNNPWWKGGKFLQFHHHQNHSIGGRNPQRVAMPTGQTVACLPSRQCPEWKHRHPPPGHPHKHNCLNLLYKVESTTTTQEHINTIMSQAIGQEYIHDVSKLPSIEPTIRYLYVGAWFLVKETWLKAIQEGNYNSWPLINVTNVACYFPESEGT